MASAFLILVFPVLAWWAPGWAISRWLLPRASRLERTATGLLLGLVTVVPLAYLPSFLLRTPLSAALILGIAAALTLLFSLLPRRHAVAPSPGEPPAQGLTVTATLIALAALAALGTTPRSFEATGVFWPCPHMSAMYLLEDGSGDGLTTFDPRWGQQVSHVFAHQSEPGYDLEHVFTNQRTGSAATLVQPILFLGSGGLVMATFLYDLLVLLFAALLFARRLRSRLMVLLLSTVFLLGVRALATYVVNENVLALGLSLGLFHLLDRRGRLPEVVAISAILALCIGTRPIAATFLPAILLMLWPWANPAAPKKLSRARLFGTFAAGLLVAAVPFLVTNYQVFGAALFHPALKKATTPIDIMGLHFQFHPLNWPFIDHLVRPASEPFPLLFQVPLEHFHAFGVAFWLLIIAGLFAVPRRAALTAALWAGPNLLLLLWLVSLDHEKLSYGMLSYAPVPLLVGSGWHALTGSTVSIRTRTWIAGAAITAFWLFPFLLEDLTLDIDPRPQYNEEVQDGRHQDLNRKRYALLEQTLLPPLDLDWDFAPSLLGHAAPAQAEPGPKPGPTLFWVALQDGFDYQVEVAPTEHPRVPDYVGRMHSERLESVSGGYLGVLVHLNSAPKVATVTASYHRYRLTVDIATGAPNPAAKPGWLSLGVIDSRINRLQQAIIRINGRPQPLHFVIEEWGGVQGRVPRLVSNRAWHAALVPDGYVLKPGRWPDTACGRIQRAGRTVGAGPQAFMDQTPKGPVRIRAASDWPPAEVPRCTATWW